MKSKKKSYNLRLSEDIIDALDKYERDNSLSINILIETLLKKYFYNKGYIAKKESKVSKTPKEIYEKRKSNFTTKKGSKGYEKLFYNGLSFGSFKNEDIDRIIKGLLNFSDKELEEISKDNWQYEVKSYSKFINEKIDNPLLTTEEFISNRRIRRWNRKNSIILNFNNEIICSFNKDKYSEKIIDNTHSFLTKLNDEELLDLIEKRKNSNKTSSVFILDYISNNKPINKKYTKLCKNGKILLQRKGNTFGSHEIHYMN